MKTAVAETSIRAYHQLGALLGSQEDRVIACMKIGIAYTRRELGVLANIENSAAMRVVNGLVKSGRVIEIGEKACSESRKVVGAVTLPQAQMELLT